MERRGKYLSLETAAKLDVEVETIGQDEFSAYLLGVREAFDAEKAES